MIITTELLRRKRACESQVTRFARAFPDGVKVTVTRCVRYAGDFNWTWAARHLVPGDSEDNLNAFYRLTRVSHVTWLDSLCRNGVADHSVQLEHAWRRDCARTFARLVRYPELRRRPTENEGENSDHYA